MFPNALQGMPRDGVTVVSSNGGILVQKGVRFGGEDAKEMW